MPKIELILLSDEWECEDCGTSFANGYVIKKDGVVVVERYPRAYCYDSDDYDGEQQLRDLCELFGCELEIRNDE